MATKTSRSQRPKSGQRRAEKPVDSEIRRAAKRAGIPSREPEGISFEESLKLNPAEQHEKLLRQVGHTDDAFIAERLRLIARQFTDRAVALAPCDSATIVDVNDRNCLREVVSDAKLAVLRVFDSAHCMREGEVTPLWDKDLNDPAHVINSALGFVERCLKLDDDTEQTEGGAQ